MLGETIKDFRLLQHYDSYDFTRLFIAEHVLIKTKAIIRVLDSAIATRPLAVDRFFSAALAANLVKHAGVVRIYDAGVHRGSPYLIEELRDGETLARRIRDGNPMPLDEVANLCRQITSILFAMRRAQLVHCDLKPRHIFLAHDAELDPRPRVMIGNFLFAKSQHAILPDAVAGTPPYMAPERWENPSAASTATDVYALGCILFELCCGRRPFHGAAVDDYIQLHTNQIAPRARDLLPSLPVALDELIAEMLAKDPAHRPSLETLETRFAAAQTWH
ncbi:MAG TPA: serine/threonine-protein kinase [Kofleriaceae bacterium]|nr:serine/threonine-protein kinase [Kofleriaceae bacterium]